jgi:GT2 family glycosyltransferase
MMDEMKVCCVTVTYGDRVNFLARVVDELMKQGIDQVVVVVNGCSRPVGLQIDELALSYSPAIVVEKFDFNAGSAIGFKRGLEIAAQTGCDYIWMLDDDNLPEDGALAVLKEFWANAVIKQPGNRIAALASLRKDRPVFAKALDEHDADALIWPANSYYGFHFRQILAKIKERIGPSRAQIRQREWHPMKIDVSCYGGLFFAKRVLTTAGFPDERMVLYADDLLFTKAISETSGEIWLVPQSVVKDIEVSYYINKKKGLIYHSSLDGKNDALVYYAVRNTIFYMSTHLVTKRSVFYLNKLFFLAFITLAGAMRGKFKRLRLIYSALYDGEHGNLGKNELYKL